jgi:hypothetical protein
MQYGFISGVLRNLKYTKQRKEQNIYINNYFYRTYILQPIQKAARSERWDRLLSLDGIAGLNLARAVDVCLL